MADVLPRRLRQRAEGLVAAVLVWSAALLTTVLFCWIIGNVVWLGAGGISWSFLTTAPENAGRAGGIAPILISTLGILFTCVLVAAPLGLATAAFLAEFTSKSRRFEGLVRTSLDVLAGVPSIVFGLFGNAFFCVALGMGYSILSGGLTLACMVLPILIRTTEQGFRAVDDEHRRAAAALGMSRTTTLFYVLFPSAVPGLMAGLVLGVGRALAETAALLFTSGSVDRMPESLFDSGRSLSVHMYTLAMDIAGGEPNAYATALVLLVVLLFSNLIAGAITSRLARPRFASVAVASERREES